MALIAVRKGVRKQLQDKFQLSCATVSMALNFQRPSLTSRRVRHAACNMYQGIYINFPK